VDLIDDRALVISHPSISSQIKVIREVLTDLWLGRVDEYLAGSADVDNDSTTCFAGMSAAAINTNQAAKTWASRSQIVQDI
jgi:hypothetical protein